MEFDLPLPGLPRLISNQKFTLRFLYFQAEKEHGVEDPYYCLSDFVAPLDTNVKDYIGCFAVSVMGAEEMATKYVVNNGDHLHSYTLLALCPCGGGMYADASYLLCFEGGGRRRLRTGCVAADVTLGCL